MSVTIDGPADFPALYRSADRASERAQRSYLRSLRVRLGALLVAAFGGALTLTTAGGFHVGGGVAFFAFACALGAELYLATTSPLTTWYEGRAAAESAKTLAWRYMVRAEPFEIDAPDVPRTAGWARGPRHGPTKFATTGIARDSRFSKSPSCHASKGNRMSFEPNPSVPTSRRAQSIVRNVAVAVIATISIAACSSRGLRQAHGG